MCVEGDRMEANIIMPDGPVALGMFLRYMDPRIICIFVPKKNQILGGTVDLYIGGARACGEDICYTPGFGLNSCMIEGLFLLMNLLKKQINQGMILGGAFFCLSNSQALIGL